MRKIVAATSLWLVLGLLLAACAPAAAPPPQPAPTKEAPAATAPRPTPPPPATTTPVSPTDKPIYGGMLKTFGVNDLSNSDLHQAFSYLDHNPMAPVYSLLVRSDPKDINKVGPDLAERWDVSPDGKVYTFFLRRGVKWHDGTPLSSADVKASFDRIVSPPKGVLSQRQAYFDAVDKIETPDGFTVRFLLKRPQAAFPAIVAVPFNAVFPKAILDQKGDMKKDIMGSGPFRFKEYIRGVQFEVEKNPDYFLPGLPYLDGVVRYIIPDSAAAKGAFVTGRL
ncbi:MAG: ABC transporter substrate-binding protein, partial [Chloroflexota bacterium]|nr:ABC transporter substrate-binding protein [Chloroflexota bacterium]